MGADGLDRRVELGKVVGARHAADQKKCETCDTRNPERHRHSPDFDAQVSINICIMTPTDEANLALWFMRINHHAGTT
jgi:hypothetical protein